MNSAVMTTWFVSFYNELFSEKKDYKYAWHVTLILTEK